MSWFNILTGLFLILSAAVHHFWTEGMRNRDVLNVGITPVDNFDNGRFRALPFTYLLH